MISIRAMKRSDISEVYRIETLSFRSPWSKASLESELKNKLAHYLVAESDGKVIGYCGMWVLFEECHITNIAVDPAYRRAGVGKALLYAAMEVGDSFDATAMTLEVRETNRIAQDLYRKLDFEQQGFRKRYYPDTGEGAMLLWNVNIPRTVQNNACIRDTFALQWETFEQKRGDKA
ncbi:MAG: ribosomal protein S18-alanine N-acetyltransferase [Clostridia bacterium]|nr:ribosomal protein S18-alanine N-acetyltransferase [Clostridia bacterium]